jgi:glutaredoxin
MGMACIRSLGVAAGTALACVVAAACIVVNRAAAEAPKEASRAEHVIEVFGREGCAHCAAAQGYLQELQRVRGELRVRHHDVGKDRAALERLRELAAQADVQAAVPAFYVRGRLFVGFDSAATTGKEIEAWLDAVSSTGVAPEGTCDVAAPCPAPSSGHSYVLRAPLLGELDVRELGLPVFTLAVGLVDGFNPCAMWVLLFLLSMLVHLKSRKRMALIGGTFVLVSGLVYFAFMAAWLNFFLIVGISRTLQLVLGTVAIAIGAVHIKDFFAFRKGISLSIPESAKPGIYRRVREVLHAERLGGALVSVIVLAAMVNIVELLCTAGLPALYTQVLTSQGLETVSYYGYLALYNVAYMLDDAVMLTIALVTLSQRKLQERGGRVLKLVSGTVMAALGVLLVLKPEWLSWG